VFAVFQFCVAASDAELVSVSAKLNSDDASRLNSLLQHGHVTIIGFTIASFANFARKRRMIWGKTGTNTPGSIAVMI
jgi:hypothetical protein